MLVVRKEGKAHAQYNSFRSAFELLEAVGREPHDEFNELQEGIPTVQKLEHRIDTMQKQIVKLQQNEQQLISMQQQMVSMQQQIDELKADNENMKADNEILRSMIQSE